MLIACMYLSHYLFDIHLCFSIWDLQIIISVLLLAKVQPKIFIKNLWNAASFEALSYQVCFLLLLDSLNRNVSIHCISFTHTMRRTMMSKVQIMYYFLGSQGTVLWSVLKRTFVCVYFFFFWIHFSTNETFVECKDCMDDVKGSTWNYQCQ